MHSPTFRAVLSPCVGICSLDDAGLCEGCHRNDRRDRALGQMSDDERLRLMELVLPLRESRQARMTPPVAAPRPACTCARAASARRAARRARLEPRRTRRPAARRDPLREAAVLVGLVPRGDGGQVLLTRRTDAPAPPRRPGQFPRRPHRSRRRRCRRRRAARKPARRSASRPRRSRPSGFLDPLCTITGFRVLPLVAMVDAGLRRRARIRAKSPRCSKCRWPSCSTRPTSSARRHDLAGRRPAAAAAGARIRDRGIRGSASGARPRRSCSTCANAWPRARRHAGRAEPDQDGQDGRLEHPRAGGNTGDRARSPGRGDRRLPLLAGRPGRRRKRVPGRRTFPGAVYAHLDRDLSDHRKQGARPPSVAGRRGLHRASWAMGHHAGAPGRGLRRRRRRACARASGGCCACWATKRSPCSTAAGRAGRRWACRSTRIRAADDGALYRRSSTRRACSTPAQVQAQPRCGRAADRCARAPSASVARTKRSTASPATCPARCNRPYARESASTAVQAADAAGRRIPRAARRQAPER